MVKLTIRPIVPGEEAAVVALWQACGLTRPWNDPAQDIAFARGKANSDVLVGLLEGRIVASVMVGYARGSSVPIEKWLDPSKRGDA